MPKQRPTATAMRHQQPLQAARQVNVGVGGQLFEDLKRWHALNALPTDTFQDTARTLIRAAIDAPEMNIGALRQVRHKAFWTMLAKARELVSSALASASSEFDIEAATYESVDQQAVSEAEAAEMDTFQQNPQGEDT